MPGDMEQHWGWPWPPPPEHPVMCISLATSVPAACPKHLTNPKSGLAAPEKKLRGINLTLKHFGEGETEVQIQKIWHSVP